MSDERVTQATHPAIYTSPYLPILSDLLSMLHGYAVDETPTMQIAALAIELELAERLTDAPDAGPVH